MGTGLSCLQTAFFNTGLSCLSDCFLQHRCFVASACFLQNRSFVPSECFLQHRSFMPSECFSSTQVFRAFRVLSSTQAFRAFRILSLTQVFRAFRLFSKFPKIIPDFELDQIFSCISSEVHHENTGTNFLFYSPFKPPCTHSFFQIFSVIVDSTCIFHEHFSCTHSHKYNCI